MRTKHKKQPEKRLKFVIADREYCAKQRAMRALYERNKAEEQAKILSGYYHPWSRYRTIS